MNPCKFEYAIELRCVSAVLVGILGFTNGPSTLYQKGLITGRPRAWPSPLAGPRKLPRAASRSIPNIGARATRSNLELEGDDIRMTGNVAGEKPIGEH